MYCGVPEEDPDKLIALVLSGGKSSRMGRDKGTMEYNGGSWVQHAGQLCAAAGLSVFYSIQSSQLEQYKSLLPVENIIFDKVDAKGPLAGLLSFYLQYPNTDVLLLPCDMIRLNKEILKELIVTYETISIGHDILVYRHADEEIEPMPGIYTSEALKKIYWLFASGDLEKHSLKYCIDISNTFFLPIQTNMKQFFMNANSKEDINNEKI